jgi:hypothetical protein
MGKSGKYGKGIGREDSELDKAIKKLLSHPSVQEQIAKIEAMKLPPELLKRLVKEWVSEFIKVLKASAEKNIGHA